ncbi:MAG: kelch repeat-containing protein [Planctomycetota bacterium]
MGVIPLTVVGQTQVETPIKTKTTDAAVWQALQTTGKPTGRHEAALVGFEGKLLLIGGRRINPVDVFDPQANRWNAKSNTPLELHHFQGVVVGPEVFLMGAMTGPFPREKPLEKVIVYKPKADVFEFRHSVPASRRRGGAGAVAYKGRIYLVGGITNGHVDGYQKWFDEYDPKTGQWRVLPDAPHARDHFQAVVIGDRLYAAGGRRTSQKTKELFSLTVGKVDIYDFKQAKWLDPIECPSLPTPRAGNSCVVVDGRLVVGGGESATIKKAHDQIESWDPKTGEWKKWPSLQRGRHGTGLVLLGDQLFTASGCGNRGGNPELQSTERLDVGRFGLSRHD